MKNGTHCRIALTLLSVALSLFAATITRANLASDMRPGPTSVTLPMPPAKHWVWINDFVLPHVADGMAYLVDGDTGRFLGMLSTGQSFMRVVLPHDEKVIYSPETYFSRGTRGTRTDVVTVYDAATLNVVTEIPIPPKRGSNLPAMANSVLTDDDRFLLIWNFNVASSVSVVDTTTRKFVGEIETPGCALVYPTGPRTFFTLCGDGGALVVEMDDTGAVAKQNRIAPFFDIDHDPLTEKPVRVGDTWYFVSFDGQIYPVHSSNGGLTVGDRWWLTTATERKQGWRPGGMQQLAANTGQNRLYAIMHQGGRDTHKDPGKDVWVYDLATRRRVLKIETRDLASSIQLSTDSDPLLYSIFMGSDKLDVYDSRTGKLRRTVENLGTTPALLVTP
jgi:methylamine dehydrogenase heavy chain